MELPAKNHLTKTKQTHNQAKNPMVVPRQLLSLAGVTILSANGDSAILYKELNEELIERPLFSRAISLTIILQGHKEIQFSDSHISLTKNQALFLKKDFMSVSDLFQDGSLFKQYLLFFDDEVVREFLSGKRLSLASESGQAFYRPVIDESFLYFVNSIQKTFQNLKRNSTSMLRLKLLEALEWLNDRDPMLSHWLFRCVNEKPNNFKRIMEENFDKGLQVQDFAVLSGRSLSSFQRDFQKVFGMSPARWIKSKKLEKAYRLLSQGKDDVTTVALDLGFENISHFIREFRSVYGVNPSEVKNKARK